MTQIEAGDRVVDTHVLISSPRLSEATFCASSRQLALLDHFRIPNEVDAKLGRRGCEQLLMCSSERALWWPSEISGEMVAASIRTADGDESIPVFAHVLADATAQSLLSEVGEGWRRASPIIGLDTRELGSIWCNADGDVFLPFDPDEVILNYLSGRYTEVVTRSPARGWLRRHRASRTPAREPSAAWSIDAALEDFFDLILGILSTLGEGPVPTIREQRVERVARPWAAAADDVFALATGGTERITMLLENNPYPQDIRVRQEAESLAAAGHSVEVIAPRAQDQAPRERVNGVDVRRFRSFSLVRQDAWSVLLEYVVAMVALHLAAMRALLRGSTVLHLHNPPDMLFPAGAVFRLVRRRVVFDHHDLSPELARTRFGSGLLVGIARLGERLTFRVASHVLAANASHAEIALERGGKRPGDVTVVRNGPRRAWTQLPMRVRSGRLSSVRLVYLGTVADQDGVDGMAEVLAWLRESRPDLDVRLTVIGDGDGRGNLESALARFGVSEQVTITGWVPLERVPELLAEGDICVDPAPATELNEHSTMIKVAEYLALGKPVVAYDLLETVRTVQDAALLVPRGDTAKFAERIALLADDPELRSSLAHRARERALALTWDKSASALLAAYAELCADRRSPRRRSAPRPRS